MPRLPHSLLLRAKSPLLRLVLRGTRTLDSAINELRWLKEHVQESVKPSTCPRLSHQRLLKLCQRRARGEPLQYILGSQPFGDLDIKCRPGVLIPRPETEAYTMHLAKLLVDGKLHESHTENFREDGKTNCKEKNNPLPTLRILDGCSGTGCISLLLHHQLSRHFRNLRIIGLDISPLAVALSNENLKRNLKKGILQESAIGKVDHQRDGRSDSAILAQRVPQVQFMAHDIFHGLPKWIGSLDIIISNPPYISNAKFNTETSRSVRNWEPKLALVPQSRSFLRPRHGPSISEPEDVFYDQLLSIHRGSFCKFLVMEVGDEEQAIRVVSLALRRRDIKVRNHIEIWRDWPDDAVDMGEMEIEGRRIFVKGSGKVRAVVLFRTRKIKTPQTKLPPLEMVEELAEEAQQKPQVPLVLGRSAAEKSDRVGTFGPDADR